MDINHPLKGSICNSCRFKVSRIIVPINEESFIESGVIDDGEINESDEVIFEHHMCKELHIDLDHLVSECSEFKNKKDNDCGGLFNNNLFK